MAKNKVIEGYYIGCDIISSFGESYILTGFTKTLTLDKTTIESYEVVTGETKKSATSVATRALVGGLLFGGVGLLAGGLSAKNKTDYLIALNFKDGKRCLIDVDEKIYKNIVSKCF